MTARDHARRPFLHAALLVLGAGTLGGLSSACTGGANGTTPPPDAFYFPVGLSVSAGGNVLYAINSDFDLQWNGGTLQSYDLFRIRHDAAELIAANFGDPTSVANLSAKTPALSFHYGLWQPCVTEFPPITNEPNGMRVTLGQDCAPPVDSTPYIGDSAIIGAFATDLQLSNFPFVGSTVPGQGGASARLFGPVRGDTTVTWADVPRDDPGFVPPNDADVAVSGTPTPMFQTPLFKLDCNKDSDDRCDADHKVGSTVDPEDTRSLTMPGEPFAMAQTPDGSALVVTHQTSQNTSLLLSGLDPLVSGGTPTSATSPTAVGPAASSPSMQFVLSGVPTGGDGLVPVPHDPLGPIKPCENVDYVMPCVRPAFLETTHSAAELDLLRYYNDDGSTLHRPFLVREVAYTLAVNQGGTDSRGIVIDTTPRLACEARSPSQVQACAQLPARVFFASRTPPSLVVGEIGLPSTSGDGSYDPDRLAITGNVPLTTGASRVYLAPIVDRAGHYALRVFVVCYDSNQVFVYDPDAQVIENVIDVGPGPFAMAFDPFDMADVATRALVPTDPRVDPTLTLKRYRFAYVASFTQSFVQLIDLDNSLGPPPTVPDGSSVSNLTFERVVFTLGVPTNPKGS